MCFERVVLKSNCLFFFSGNKRADGFFRIHQQFIRLQQDESESCAVLSVICQKKKRSWRSGYFCCSKRATSILSSEEEVLKIKSNNQILGMKLSRWYRRGKSISMSLWIYDSFTNHRSFFLQRVFFFSNRKAEQREAGSTLAVGSCVSINLCPLCPLKQI